MGGASEGRAGDRWMAAATVPSIGQGASWEDLWGKLQECKCVLQKLETLGFLPLFAVPETPLGLNFCQVHISFATLLR